MKTKKLEVIALNNILIMATVFIAIVAPVLFTLSLLGKL